MPKSHPSHIKEDALALVQRGFTHAEVSKHLTKVYQRRVPISTIRSWLDKANIASKLGRGRPPKSRNPTQKDINTWLSLHKQGLSPSEIAERTNALPGTVHYHVVRDPDDPTFPTKPSKESMNRCTK